MLWNQKILWQSSPLHAGILQAHCSYHHSGACICPRRDERIMLSSASTIQHAPNLQNMRLGCALAFNRFSSSWCTSCSCRAVLQLAMGWKMLNSPASGELSLRHFAPRHFAPRRRFSGLRRSGVTRLHCTSTAATHTSQNEFQARTSASNSGEQPGPHPEARNLIPHLPISSFARPVHEQLTCWAHNPEAYLRSQTLVRGHNSPGRLSYSDPLPANKAPT